jgi:hypothetical protein
MITGIQNNEPKKPSKLLGIGAIVVGLIILALPLYFIFGAFQLTPNPAQSKAQPIIALAEQLGGKKICQSGFNGVGGIDTNTPAYTSLFDVPYSNDLAQRVIAASEKTGYEVRKVSQNEAFALAGSMHIMTTDPDSNGFEYYLSPNSDGAEYFSNNTNYEIMHSVLRDTLEIAIIHGKTIQPTICVNREISPSSSDNAILAIQSTLWDN